MKKVLLIVIMLVSVVFAKAQNYVELNVTDIEDGETRFFCTEDQTGVIIHGRLECDQNEWHYNGQSYIADYIVVNSIVDDLVYISHLACGQHKGFVLYFLSRQIDNPFGEPVIWKRTGETVMLFAGDYGYTTTWSNGETTEEIEVTEPGVYSVTIVDTEFAGCVDTTFSIEVRDNVELYRATIDLETNLNKTTWQTTPEQAEYISEVKVYRDGLLVGIAPYEQGYYLDAIGSDNAARNYQIVGVSIEGEDCPIPSYQKGTIHTTYYQDVNNNLNMTWNIPYVEEGALGTLTCFQICKYDPNTGDLTVVDQVNSSITDYTCGVNQFDGGYAVIAAVFSDAKGFEELSFSNLTTDILGIGENGGPSTGSGTLTVYPNPAKDRVTIKGTGMAIITNALGQTILTKEIDGKAAIELPRGLYFVKLGGTTRKIVVE